MGTDYRKFYCQQVGKQYDSSKFDIHHINLNRKDNRIENLVALPKKLHRQYHFYKRVKDDISQHNVDYIGGIEDEIYLGHFRNKTLEAYQTFYSVIHECTKWVEERNELLAKKGRWFY
jgi:poly-beta-hydroxyalkanoate depolymerase